jgi:hypothetical protein
MWWAAKQSPTRSNKWQIVCAPWALESSCFHSAVRRGYISTAQKANAALVVITIADWPFIFTVTLRDIIQDEEIT